MVNVTPVSTVGLQFPGELIVLDFAWSLLAFFLTVSANVCLLTLEGRVWYRRKFITQPKQLIFFLATVDLFSTVFGFVPRIAVLSRNPCDNEAFRTVILLSRFCLFCSMNLSRCTVVLMGIERWLAIRVPFFYVRNCTVRTFCFMEVGIVVYVLTLAVISLLVDLQMINVFQALYIQEQSCHALFLTFDYTFQTQFYNGKWPYSGAIRVITYLLLLQDSILVIILLICNTAVVRGLSAMEKRLLLSCPRQSENLSAPADILAVTGREFSRLMIAISITYLILTMPYLVRLLCNLTNTLPSTLADVIARRMNMSISFTNPFLYGLLRKKIRRHLYRRLLQCLCCNRPNRVFPVESVHNSETNIGLPIRHVYNEQTPVQTLPAVT